MFETLAQYLHATPDFVAKLFKSVIVLAVIWILRVLACWLAKRRIEDLARFYHVRRSIAYGTAVVALVLIGRIWVKGVDSLATFLGLASAGIAIAMHDTIANLAGWLFILWRRPFKVGDRIQLGDIAGDVIDTRIFEFSVIEIGKWVDAEQSTGRIVHVPNSMVLREPLANYEAGFKYIWHEIPVLITFESNWQKAKQILSEIARQKTEHLSDGVEAQIRRAARRFLIHAGKLTPIVYTAVRDSGVLLTIRYIVQPRQRRDSEAEVWETILERFAACDDIALAYPTTRFYTTGGRYEPASSD